MYIRARSVELKICHSSRCGPDRVAGRGRGRDRLVETDTYRHQARSRGQNADDLDDERVKYMKVFISYLDRCSRLGTAAVVTGHVILGDISAANG